jgi:UDP-2-acetamido-3-amino-2,3-dideoxy-glucuronate N-acetyltransferase
MYKNVFKYIVEKGKNIMSTFCKKGKICDVFVHALADVSPLATILPGTKVWRFSHIDDYAYIGRNCMIAMGCYVAPGVVIDDNCRIQNNVSVFRGVRLEKNVFVGPSVVFTNVKYPKIFRKADYGDTLIKEGAVLGANCTIIAGVTIGKSAFIGANSVVTKDIPDFALVMGNPARVVKILSPDWSEFDKTTD